MSLLLTLVVSCNKPEPEPVVEPLPFAISDTLLRIDSLMQHDADSALIMLMSFRPTDTFSSFRPTEGSGEIPSQFNANYQSLLLSEALYKTDNAQSNRDEVQTAVQYFDSIYAIYHTDELAMFAARSHYMNGVGHYENDSLVNALKEYLRTLEIMENHFEDNDITGYRAKFMGLTNNRLIELFSNQYMMEPAIYCCKNALYYNNIQPTSKYSTSKILLSIGKQYYKLGETDSASYYFNKAFDELPDYNNSLYRDIAAYLTLYDYQLGLDGKSSLDSLKRIVGLANDDSEDLSKYLGIGYIFYNEQLYDSARIYFEEVFNHSKTVIVKIQAAEFLYEISNYYRNEDESAKYAKFLAVNKKIEAENKALVSKLNDIYQSYLNKKIEKRFLKDKLELRQRIVLIIVSVSFLCIIIFVITHGFGRRRVAKHKAAWEKTAGTLSEIMMKIEVKKFTDEPICKMIMSIVNEQQFKSKIDYYYYRDFALGKEHLMELREAVNLHYDSFTIRLRNKYPELTDYDIDYCCLYLLGLKDADVAALMQKEYSNVCRRNRKIRKIIKSNNGLTETLYNLTNLQ